MATASGSRALAPMAAAWPPARVTATPWVWFAPCLSQPAPEWLPTLAEALAGTLFHPTDQFEPRSFNELLRLRAELAARPPRDHWTRWAQWFFADRASRPAQPVLPPPQ
jgi:hypothetical protein